MCMMEEETPPRSTGVDTCAGSALASDNHEIWKKILFVASEVDCYSETVTRYSFTSLLKNQTGQRYGHNERSL